MMKSIFKNVVVLMLCCVATAWGSSVDNNDNPQDSKPISWYKPINAYDQDKLDVIYFISTNVLSAKDSLGNVAWQSQLAAQDVEAMRKEAAHIERNMFHDDFNVYAPYYHQYTFDAISLWGKPEFDKVYANVVKDACRAFDYYMTNMNHGRPYVLAGFSQGGMLVLDVLKHMTDEQYRRMVACYAVGYRLSSEDLKHPHIKAATGETDNGVVVSFNSVQTPGAVWPFVAEGAATCINPVNWKTDATPANFTFSGTTNEVHVDTKANVLVVKTDNPQFYYDYYDKATFFLDAGVSRDNLHHWDMLFYENMIHDNALKRAGR